MVFTDYNLDRIVAILTLLVTLIIGCRTLKFERQNSTIQQQAHIKQECLDLTTAFYEFGRDGLSEKLKELITDPIEYYNAGELRIKELSKYLLDQKTTARSTSLRLDQIATSYKFNESNNTAVFDVVKVTSDNSYESRIITEMSYQKKRGRYKISSIKEIKDLPTNNVLQKSLKVEPHYIPARSTGDYLKIRKGPSLLSEQIDDPETGNKLRIHGRDPLHIIEVYKNENLNQGYLKGAGSALLILDSRANDFYIRYTSGDFARWIAKDSIQPIVNWYYVQTEQGFRGFVVSDYIAIK